MPLWKSHGGEEDLPTGEAFRTEWIDFENGIRVGNLEPHERITQILKFHLETQFNTRFVIDRWGRGQYWQWICWLPRANREAKPVSSDVNFGCAKLFIMVDRDESIFKCGLQVERGTATGRGNRADWELQDDWDWHRLLKQCRKGSALDTELRRLIVREGFSANVGSWEPVLVLTADNYHSASQIKRAAAKCVKNDWAGFQLYYPMPQDEVESCAGPDLVKAMLAAFNEVIPSMNECMQVGLEPDQQ